MNINWVEIPRTLALGLTIESWIDNLSVAFRATLAGLYPWTSGLDTGLALGLEDFMCRSPFLLSFIGGEIAWRRSCYRLISIELVFVF